MDIENEPQGDLINREADSTTLKQCGWCKYAMGTHRYNYCISGSCRLDKSYSKDIMWNDECRFINASQSDIQAVIDNHENTINSAESSIKTHKQHIFDLRMLMKDKPERPPLPDDRKHDHFNIDEPIMLFYKGEWLSGDVKYGYRHQDGMVSYRLDGMGPQGGDYWGNGCAVPTILLKDEFDFFKNNPEQYQAWAKVAYNKSFNGDRMDIAPI